MDALTTPRLALEPLTVEHAPAMFPVLSDAAIYRYLDYGPPASIEYLEDVYRCLASAKSPDGGQDWLNWIVRPHRQAPVGYVQATVFGQTQAWVAYVLDSVHWGHGYAKEATAAMIDHLASKWGVTRYLATVEVANAASIRLLERLGFRAATGEEAAAEDLTETERLFVRERA